MAESNAARRRKAIERATGTTYKTPRREGARLREGDPFRAKERTRAAPRARARSSPRMPAGAGLTPGGPSGGGGGGGALPRVRLPDPVGTGRTVGGIGTLEAEFFGAMVLVGLTIFTDPKASSDYPSVMLAAMKRGTMLILAFFLLALLSAAGNNAARFAKAFGALIIVGLILAQAENGLFSELDKFFQADWTSGGTESSSGAQSGQQNTAPGSGAASGLKGAISTALGDAQSVKIGSDIVGGSYDLARSAGTALKNKVSSILNSLGF